MAGQREPRKGEDVRVNKKAPSMAATTQGAEERATQDSNTQRFHLQVRDLLSHGAINAISAANLAKIAGYGDNTRQLRHAITWERQNGAVILSNKAGYYLPSENIQQREAELRAYKRRWDAVLRSNRLNVAAVNQMLKQIDKNEIEGQEMLY